MNESDLQLLTQELQSLRGHVELIVHAKKDDPFSQGIKQFAQAVSCLFSGKITVQELPDDWLLSGLPGLTIANDQHRSIRYACIPQQHEISPFAHAVAFVAQGNAPIPPQTRRLAQKITTPAEIMVLVSPFCTNCPLVVEAAIGLAATNQLISAHIIDVQHFSHLAEQYTIQSVPATIIDQHLVHIGEIPQERLAEILVNRGTAAYRRDFMRSLIDRGNIHEAAHLLCQERDVKDLLKLFEDGDLSMRMGVLVVFEEALEKDKQAIQEMVPNLIHMLTNEDARIRGDIADLLGKIGDPRALPHLERLTTDPDPDVVDAATEALEVMQVAQCERAE